jgi:hypothetical protein
MATIANLTARLERLEQQMDRREACYHILYLYPGEDEHEAIERQKREKEVRDGDPVIVVQLVDPPIRNQ